MLFALIEPAQGMLRHQVDAADLDAALRMVGLRVAHVDHAGIWRDAERGLAIVVAEFGLFVPPQQQHYFSLLRGLYAGNAVLYAFDGEGSTIDVRPQDVPVPVFYRSVGAIERAIAENEIARPSIRVMGKLKWQWPQPRPDLDAIADSIVEELH